MPDHGIHRKTGVIIPKQNLKNLMLKESVIGSVRKGEFHLYAIGHVDEGIEILTGIPAGEPDSKGNIRKEPLTIW
jgi:predicted ATP-dependent protease